MYAKWTLAALAVIGTAILINAQTCFGDIQGDLELLKTIADGYEANLAKLETWAGEATIVSSVSNESEQGAMRRQQKYKAEFLLNRELDAIRWKWFCLAEFDPNTREWHSSDLNLMFGLTKGDCDYVLFFYGRAVQDALRILNIYRRDQWPDHFEGIGFDPLHILAKEIYPDVVGQLRYYHRLGGTMKSNGSITREGDIVTLQTGRDYEGHGKITTRFVFDLSKGCCLTEFFNSSASSQTHWELEYEKIAGVFLMKTISHVHKDSHGTSERRATLTSSMVNGSAGKAEFLLGTLGLRPGDKIRDTRTNVMYIFGEKGATEVDMPPKISVSLLNKALPDFEGIQIELATGQSKDRMILVCFFDRQQRPSRNCITQLAKRAEQLQEKGVTVVAVQASKLDESELNEWVKKNNVPFPVGIIESDEKKTQAAWGVKALPWLILTDKEHVVTAEGFGLGELDARIKEIGPSASRPSDSNKVIGLVKDPNAAALSGVRVTEFQTDEDYTTDADGKFVSAFGPSNERRFFFAMDKQRQLVGVGMLGPGETHVEIKLAPGKMVSGTVVDSNGKPVAGAQVAPLPMTCFHVLTDDQGQFDLGWSREWAGDLTEFFIMARHLGRNLAAGVEIDGDTLTVRIELEPALTLLGSVEDPDGVPIPGALVGLSLRRGWACGTPVKKVVTDDRGRYEFPTLPQRQEYINYADAEGFWPNQITTGIINRTIDREGVGPIILKRPILSVSGIVVHASGKAVADIRVHLQGEGQPELDSKTDADGRFVFERVCCGPVEISAKNEALFGKIETEGGAKDVKLVVRLRFE